MRRTPIVAIAGATLAATLTGCEPTPWDVTPVARSATGAMGNGCSGHPVMSPDGTQVAFVSAATNLHPADTDTSLDIYLRDLTTGAVTLVTSPTPHPGSGIGDSPRPTTKLRHWRCSGDQERRSFVISVA